MTQVYGQAYHGLAPAPLPYVRKPKHHKAYKL